MTDVYPLFGFISKGKYPPHLKCRNQFWTLESDIVSFPFTFQILWVSLVVSRSNLKWCAKIARPNTCIYCYTILNKMDESGINHSWNQWASKSWESLEEQYWLQHYRNHLDYRDNLVCWVLWHINLCRLFNVKSIFT